MPRGRKKKEDNVLLVPRKSEDTEKDMIAISRDFNRALLYATDYLKWSNLQKKIFTLILGEINWKNWNNGTEIYLNNKEVMKALGWDLNGDERNMTVILNKELKYMVTHCAVSVRDPYSNDWFVGNIFMNARGKLGITYVELNPNIMPHVEGLYDTADKKKKQFIQYVKPDLISFTSKFAAPLFSELCSCAKVGKNIINRHKIKVPRLRNLFDLKDTDYMRKSSSGKRELFDSYNFEKRGLNPAVADINNTEMLKLIPYEDGLYFKRIKSGASVIEYEFQYIVLNDKEVYNHRKKFEEAHRTGNNKEVKSEPEYLQYISEIIEEYEDSEDYTEIEYTPESRTDTNSN